MAFPNLNNIINGYSRPEMIPNQEKQNLLHVYEKKQTNKIEEVDDPGGISDNQRAKLARSISDTDLPHTTTSPARRRSKSSCCFGCPVAAVEDDGNPDEKQVPKPSTSSAFSGDKAPAAAARTLVLTASLHCEGCTLKIIEKIKKIKGVEGVRAYIAKDEIEVDTTLSSYWLTENLSGKLGKKVELVLVQSSDQAIGLSGRENNKENTNIPILNDSVESEVHYPPVKLPNRDTVMNTTPNGPEPKLDRKDQIPDIAELPQSGYTKTRDKNNKTKLTSQRPNSAALQPIGDSLEAIATSVAVLKVRLHCHDCVDKIRRLMLKIRGVEQVKFNIEKELMEVQGTMDIKQQLPYLTEKLKRDVKIIQVRPCPENSQEDNREDAEEAKTKKPVADKVENVQESGVSTINDRMSKIDDKRQDRSLKPKKDFLDLLQDYISMEPVESPKPENDCDKTSSDESEDSDRKKLLQKVPKEERANGGFAVIEINKLFYAYYCPTIYQSPPIYHSPFSEENPNACCIM